MSRLFIRDKSCGYITFLNSVSDVTQFWDSYIPGRRLVLGDVFNYNKRMRGILLKFLEENPIVDCYSSMDLCDPILESRFLSIIKAPLSISTDYGEDKYLESNKDYTAAFTHLTCSKDLQLRAPLHRGSSLKLIMNDTGNQY